MELLTWLLVGGTVFAIAYVVLSIALGRYFYKEFKRSQKHHASHANKMAEMKKDFEEKQRENKNKMNRFR